MSVSRISGLPGGRGFAAGVGERVAARTASGSFLVEMIEGLDLRGFIGSYRASGSASGDAFPGGGENSGLGWRFRSASGGDFDRPVHLRQ